MDTKTIEQLKTEITDLLANVQAITSQIATQFLDFSSSLEEINEKLAELKKTITTIKEDPAFNSPPALSTSNESKSKLVVNNSKKPPVDGRPRLKEAVKEALETNGASMTPIEIWKVITDRWGYWSRQSLYAALKDKTLFQKNEGEVCLKDSEPKDDVDTFIETVKADTSIRDVV